MNSPLKFDNTITLGHVITLATFVTMGAAGYFDLRERIALAEHSAHSAQVLSEAEKRAVATSLVEIKTDIREVRRAVEAIKR